MSNKHNNRLPTRQVTKPPEQPELDDVTRFHPLGDLVLLRMEPEKVTRGGIIIPDAAEVSLPIGRVLELGPEASGKGLQLADLVLFAPQAGVQLDRRHFFIEVEKIAARVDPQRVVAA